MLQLLLADAGAGSAMRRQRLVIDFQDAIDLFLPVELAFYLLYSCLAHTVPCFGAVRQA